MSGLREIRTRINSITSTQKITSAMKMVSAAKFHKSQETINRFKPYSKKVFEVLSQVIPSAPETELDKWFSPSQKLEKVALIVLTSNSSMCAGFNQNLLKHIVDVGPSIYKDIWDTNNLSLYCLGKKGSDFFSKRGFSVIYTDTDMVNKPLFSLSADLLDLLASKYINKELDAVYVAYNQFVNPAVQNPTITQFFPYSLPDLLKSVRTNPDLIFEPNKEYILEIVIPTALRTFFHEIVLENAIGEHGARMTAMHQATENASDLNKALKLQYNKARQASITKEILEIVSGAEALKVKDS
jgi:F-type H+-transporting ATPase subunit gamma